MNLGLRPLQIRDRSRLEHAIQWMMEGRRTPLALWAFAPHFIWRDFLSFYWTELDGWLCLFAEYTDGIYMPLPPMGPGPMGGAGGHCPLQDILAVVFAFMKNRNQGSAVTRIENIPGELKEMIEPLGYLLTPKDADYLYRTCDLIALKGDRYKSPRAAYNRFLRSHRVRIVPYNLRDRDACLALFSRWATQKEDVLPLNGEHAHSMARLLLQDAGAAHYTALHHAAALGLTGRIAWVDGTIRGYTFGYERSSEVFCILLEVADRTIYGLAQYLFREFCREMTTYPFINTMDDSGLVSLARSKRAYHPWSMVKNYIATSPAGACSK